MTVIERLRYRSYDASDPDDFRPGSTWAMACDPARADGAYVRDLAVTVDIVAPGDRVPLHTHPIDEVVLVEDGTAEFVLGTETWIVEPGAVAFVPAGIPHGARAGSSAPVRFLGIFPSTRIGIELLERNPAPGTEGSRPQPPYVLDVRGELAATEGLEKTDRG